MRRISLIQTSDGHRHETERKAREYCEVRVGEILVGIASEIAIEGNGKWKPTLDLLEKHMERIAEAHRWRTEATAPLEEEED